MVELKFITHTCIPHDKKNDIHGKEPGWIKLKYAHAYTSWTKIKMKKK